MKKNHLILFVVAILSFAMVLPQTGFAQGAGRALTFDGSTEYVLLGNDASLNLTTAFTIEMWAKTTSVIEDNKQVLYCRKSSTNERGYGFALYGDDVRVGINKTAFFEATDVILTIDTWYHLAGTFDTTTDTVRIYVNGVERFAGDTTLQPGSQAGYPTFAKASETDTDYFGGTLDEVRIWSVARTQAQIQEYMCKKYTPTIEDDLVAYWRLDESTVGAGSAKDSKGSIDGTPSVGMINDDCVWSGAALGDDSAHDYDVADGYTQNLIHSDGDDITATVTSFVSMSGIQVYRVDATSMRAEATKPDVLWTMDPLRYWGVFVVGESPVYTATYNYDAHPGITDQSDLGLAVRSDHNDNSWADLGATLNTDANTLTQTGITASGEYALGSETGDNSLPVTLTSFAATGSSGEVVVRWTVQSEVNNAWFRLFRGPSRDGEYVRIARIAGRGSDPTRHEYSYTDRDIRPGQSYWYKLEDVSYEGKATEHGPVEALSLSLPQGWALAQNVPNPFNPVTEIRYQLPEASVAVLAIYDALGREVRVLVDGFVEAGYRSLVWDGRDEAGELVASGVYVVRMEAGDFLAVRKLTLIR